MRKLGNGIESRYGQLTIVPPNPGGNPLTILQAVSGTASLSVGTGGNVTIAAPASGDALAITSLSGSFAVNLTGANAATGQTLKVAGSFTGSGTTSLVVFNDVNNTNGCNLRINGGGTNPSKTIRAINGALQILNDAYTATLFQVVDAGNVTINAPTSGIALTVTGFAGSSALKINTTGIQVGSPTGGDKGAGTINVDSNYYINGTAISAGASGANPTGTVGLTVVNGSAGTFLRSDGAPALSQAIIPTWTAQHIFSQVQSTSGTAGNAAIMVNSTAPAISIVNTGGATDAKTWELSASATVLSIKISNDAGSTTKNALNVTRAANIITAMQYGNATDATGLDHLFQGSLRLGTATALGGNGNINSNGVYQNGIPLLSTGTFTGTLTGMTAGTTGTVTWTISGQTATLQGHFSGTSNTTAMTMTGLPAALQPATLTSFVPCAIEDNSTDVVGAAFITNGSGTIQFYRDVLATGVLSSTGFTASGVKGFDHWTITYSLQ